MSVSSALSHIKSPLPPKRKKDALKGEIVQISKTRMAFHTEKKNHELSGYDLVGQNTHSQTYLPYNN